METFKVYNKKVLVILTFGYMLAIVILCVRLGFLMIYKSTYYGTKAVKEKLHIKQTSLILRNLRLIHCFMSGC